MTRVVTYCRVSSDEQAQKDLSIPAQRKALLRWVEQDDEVELVECFVDEGESAYSAADKRPGFCRMIAFCRRNNIDLILVHKLDRFSRNREESILFKSLLRKHGVTVKSITENYDPETPQGFLYEGMIEVINQFYSMNLATETMKGMRENAERGYHNGGQSPYAYRTGKITDEAGREHVRLVHGPDNEVEVVREIFRLALDENRGAKSITRILNRRGIPSARSPHWSMSSVGQVLNNRSYCGDTVWNKRNTKTGKTKDKSEWVTVENTHEAIINRDDFMRRKEMASKRTFNLRSSPHRKSSYLLSKLIRCGNCGAAFVGHRHRKKRKDGSIYELHRYRCNTYLTKGIEVCPAVAIHREWVEEEIIKLIEREICSQERKAALRNLVATKIEARRKLYSKDPKELERRMVDIDRKIQNYYRAIAEGMDPEICKKHIDELQCQRSEIEEEAGVLNQENYYTRAIYRNICAIEDFARAFTSDFPSLPMEAQRRVLMHFIDEVTVVDREMVRVKLKIPFDDGGIRHLTDELSGDIVKASNAEGGGITGLLMRAQEGVRRTNEKGAVQEGPAQAAKRSYGKAR